MMMKIRLKIKDYKKIFNQNVWERLYDYDTRIEVNYGGASSGKSQGVYQKVAVKSMNNWKVPRKVLILRKVQASIKDSSWQHMKDVLEQFKILDQCKINKSELTITLPNGAMFLFKGLDNPEKIKSIKGISDIVMEEATEFTLEDYTQLGLRLRDRKHIKKQMFLMFNPVSKKNWVFEYFFTVGDSSAKVLHSTYTDNRFLDEVTKAEIEKLKFRNPAYYKIYALGEFATLDKLVFPIYTKRIITQQEAGHLPQYNGLDFGYVNDPSALLTVRYDKENKRIFITGEYVKEGLLNDQIATVIKALGLQKEKLFADSADQKSIEEIRQHHIPNIRPVKKWAGSIMQGLQWLLQHEIIIDERCFKTITEFENYTWKKDKKTGEYINEPVDTYNHTIDAIRYALSEQIKGHAGVRAVKKRKGLGI